MASFIPITPIAKKAESNRAMVLLELFHFTKATLEAIEGEGRDSFRSSSSELQPRSNEPSRLSNGAGNLLICGPFWKYTGASSTTVVEDDPPLLIVEEGMMYHRDIFPLSKICMQGDERCWKERRSYVGAANSPYLKDNICRKKYIVRENRSM